MSRVKEVERVLTRYAGNILAYVSEILHATPTDQQARMLRAAAVPGSRVAVKSGHGIGKTTSLAWVNLWGLTVLSGFKGRITAPTRAQLMDNAWSELRQWVKRMDPWFRRQLVINSDLAYVAGLEEWHLSPRVAKRETAEAFQGVHAPNVILTGDEASGIPNEIFEAGRGSMSTAGSRLLLASNPTRNQGFFYDVCEKGGERWTVFTFSSLDSPLVDPEYPREIAEEYGVDSDYYRVRVLGEFPREEVAQLISRELAEIAAKRKYDRKEYIYAPIILGVAPAWMGDDRSVIFLRQGLRSQLLGVWRKIDNMDLADLVAQAEDKYRAKVVCVDVGWGAGVIDRLRQLGRNPVPVNFGGSPVSNQYRNKRTEMWFKLRDWLRAGGQIPNDQALIDDLVAPHYMIDENTGKKILERKKDIKSRGLPSPDTADALALTFAAEVKPEPSPEDRMLWEAQQTSKVAVTEYDILDMKR